MLFLNALSKNVKFGYWFFGKYHQDKQIPPRYYAMFRNVILAPGQEVKKKNRRIEDILKKTHRRLTRSLRCVFSLKV